MKLIAKINIFSSMILLFTKPRQRDSPEKGIFNADHLKT